MTADDWKRKSVYLPDDQIHHLQSQGEYQNTHLEILSNFTNEPLEGELPDEELGRLLVSSDLTKSDRSRAETMGLLHTTRSSL